MKNSNEMLDLIREMRSYQEKNLLNLGKRIIPALTSDDVLQPNDFPELELNPHFRYEEGILHGIQSVEMALQAKVKDATYNHEAHD